MSQSVSTALLSRPWTTSAALSRDDPMRRTHGLAVCKSKSRVSSTRGRLPSHRHSRTWSTHAGLKSYTCPDPLHCLGFRTGIGTPHYLASPVAIARVSAPLSSHPRHDCASAPPLVATGRRRTAEKLTLRGAGTVGREAAIQLSVRSEATRRERPALRCSPSRSVWVQRRHGACGASPGAGAGSRGGTRQASVAIRGAVL